MYIVGGIEQEVTKVKEIYCWSPAIFSLDNLACSESDLGTESLCLQ